MSPVTPAMMGELEAVTMFLLSVTEQMESDNSAVDRTWSQAPPRAER